MEKDRTNTTYIVVISNMNSKGDRNKPHHNRWYQHNPIWNKQGHEEADYVKRKVRVHDIAELSPTSLLCHLTDDPDLLANTRKLSEMINFCMFL